MYNNTLPNDCEMIRKLNRYNLIKGLIGWVLAALVIFGALFLSGCASLDPLGSPAAKLIEPKGEPDYPTRGGVICREIAGTADVVEITGSVAGFRCLDVGEQSVEGCVQYNDGRFSYQSPGCDAE